MLFQEAPAETLDFMIYGFAVILGSMALFILSLARRAHNLRRELAQLGELEDKLGEEISEGGS